MNIIPFFRQYRIEGYAIFDFVLAFLGIYLLAPLLSKLFRKVGIEITRKSWMYLTLPIGVLSHLLSGHMTPMTQDFFNPSGHYVLKGAIILLLILGLKDIKKIKK